MVQGPLLYLILLLGVAFVVVATSKFKLHPFLSLILASFGVGIAAGVPLPQVVKAINDGFGGLMSYIGIVIVAGTVIGKILEKSGAALRMAEVVLRVVGERRPHLAMSLIGSIVSIPVFCDSAFVILASLKRSLARRAKAPLASMSVALGTGLYATHTLVPPTPGPIAAAGNLGASGFLGTIILIGLIIAIPTMLAGYFWATKVASTIQVEGDNPLHAPDIEVEDDLKALPSTLKSFTPIFLPIVLIGLGSIISYIGWEGSWAEFLLFLGTPVVALLIGVIASFALLPHLNEETLTGWVGEGLQDSAIILLLTGAGGAFGAVIKATPISQLIQDFAGGEILSGTVILLIAFLISAALKTAQGSTTAAIVITSALIAPTVAQAGIVEAVPLALVVMAIGAGSMVVSHVNDSYFWVVTQFSGMKVTEAYKAHTMGSLLQGTTALGTAMLLWALLV